MPTPRKMYCSTCKRDEPHHPLSKGEQQQLKDDSGLKYTGAYWACDAPGCGTLRTAFDKSPFDLPRKLK